MPVRTKRYPIFAGIGALLVSFVTVQSASEVETESDNEVVLSPQAELIRQSWTHQSKVNDLAYSLFKANADSCGKNTRQDLGIRWVAIADFEGTDQRFAAIELGVA